jgi:hypothetical protein
MSEYLMTASSEFESEVIRERIAEAGITVLVEGQQNPRAHLGSGRAVYVEARDLERARQVLAEAENVDEDELARLSEEAGKRISENT